MLFNIVLCWVWKVARYYIAVQWFNNVILHMMKAVRKHQIWQYFLENVKFQREYFQNSRLFNHYQHSISTWFVSRFRIVQINFWNSGLFKIIKFIIFSWYLKEIHFHSLVSTLLKFSNRVTGFLDLSIDMKDTVSSY